MAHFLDLAVRIAVVTVFAFFFSVTLVVIGDEFGVLAALLFAAAVFAGVYWLFVQTVVKRF